MNNNLLDELNPEQQRAVKTTNGPLLILAGAGSGKTKTLTHRIAYMIQNEGVSPHAILAVTFTNKAAAEMRERLNKLIGLSSIPFMGTFHGICVRILRESGAAIGIPAGFTIFDTADQLSAIKQTMNRLSIDEKTIAPRAILSLISSAKNELIDAKAYGQFAASPMQKKAAEIYPLYEQMLKEAKGLDFDDLLMQTVRLFKVDEAVRTLWTSRFRHILVDEYQDTNTAQYELIKILAAPHGNLCVVGDDWQSIYSWRGADFRNILNFERDWPDATIIKLEQNYRSTRRILEAAHQVIMKNRQRSDKKLWTQGAEGEPVAIVPVSDERHEAETIVRRIQAGVDLGLRKLRDFAVLYRTNAQSRSLEDIFVRYGVPYRIVGSTRFYERKEVKDILAYLRFLFQSSDRIAFTRLINTPPRGIGQITLDRMLNSQITLDELMANPAEHLPRLSAKSLTEISKLTSLLQILRRKLAGNTSLSDIVEQLIKGIGYLEYLDDGTIRAEERIENVKELLSVAKQYDPVGLAGFLEEVALVSDVDEWDNAANAVTLMTVHAAKGLEFPVVFMAGMEEGIFPHSRTQFEPDELEEERRLAYVGMTRAKEELYLLHAQRRLLFGSITPGIPSRFLTDIGDHARVMPSQQIGGDSVTASLVPKPAIEIIVGDEVAHPVFGHGIVSELTGETAIIVFKGRGSKRLNLAFAPLTKL